MMQAGWGALVLAMLTGLAPVAATMSDPPLPPPRPPDLHPDLPLPPPRPADLLRSILGPVFGPPRPPAAPPSGAVPLDEELTCVRLFNSGKVEARAVLPPVATAAGCGIAAPLEMSAIVVSPTRRIEVAPPVTIDCALGEAIADWVREDLVPAFTGTAPLAALTGTSGYACRGRNGVVGAKLSEHGRGNAMDIGAFRTADGHSIEVKQAGTPLLAAVKATACARFATVLGPGSDGFHESHLHVDLEERRHGSKICHWDLP